MIVSIHQPAYIPWLGYFHKIANSDAHIFLDDVEYSKNNLFNRNKIKTSQGVVMWLTIPVKRNNRALLSETLIDNSANWQKKHLLSIKSNYSKASFFEKYFDIFQKIYSKPYDLLSEFNIDLNKKISSLFGIKTNFVKSSDLNVKGKSNERLINLCNNIGADTYLSGKGAISIDDNACGKPYLSKSMFKTYNIDLRIQDFKQPYYNQLWGAYISNLSAIDFLFNMGGENFKKIVK